MHLPSWQAGVLTACPPGKLFLEPLENIRVWQVDLLMGKQVSQEACLQANVWKSTLIIGSNYCIASQAKSLCFVFHKWPKIKQFCLVLQVWKKLWKQRNPKRNASSAKSIAVWHSWSRGQRTQTTVKSTKRQSKSTSAIEGRFAVGQLVTASNNWWPWTLYSNCILEEERLVTYSVTLVMDIKKCKNLVLGSSHIQESPSFVTG